jgi:hypothetical protein
MPAFDQRTVVYRVGKIRATPRFWPDRPARLDSPLRLRIRLRCS